MNIGTADDDGDSGWPAVVVVMMMVMMMMLLLLILTICSGDGKTRGDRRLYPPMSEGMRMEIGGSIIALCCAGRTHSMQRGYYDQCQRPLSHAVTCD